MCDTDQQCHSPQAVTPVPPKACKTPHISHITSLKSFILFSVLCDLTQWLFMPRDPVPVCECAHTWAHWCVQGQVKPGLCYMTTGLSLFSLHTSASLFAPVCLLSTLSRWKKYSHCCHPYRLLFSLPIANDLMKRVFIVFFLKHYICKFIAYSNLEHRAQQKCCDLKVARALGHGWHWVLGRCKESFIHLV